MNRKPKPETRNLDKVAVIAGDYLLARASVVLARYPQTPNP